MVENTKIAIPQTKEARREFMTSFVRIYTDVSNPKSYMSIGGSLMEMGLEGPDYYKLVKAQLRSTSFKEIVAQRIMLIKEELNISKEEYLAMVFSELDKCKSPGVRYKYVELVGKIFGFVEAERIENTSVFNSIRNEITAFVENKTVDIDHKGSDE